MRLALLLDSLSTTLTSSFSNTCAVFAVLWLTYRAYLVLSKPLDELVTLLGFEIPQGPHVDLAEVKADGAVLHWKPHEDRRSTHRYEVQIDGTRIGEVPQSDSSIIISSLKPDHNYIIRIVVINSLDFRATSDPVRIHTKPASSADFFPVPAAPTTADGELVAPRKVGPTLRTFKTLPDTSPSPLAAPAMARETSNGPGATKRNTAGRRPAATTWASDQNNVHAEEYPYHSGAEETQQELTAKLDEIGRDTAEMERQIQEEEAEAATTKVELVKERDELRSCLREKDNTSRDFKKQVNALERENTAAQNKKSAQDRALQQKKSEFQKVKDDTSRWQREIGEMDEAVVQFGVDKINMLEEMEKEKAVLQEKNAQEVQTLKIIEDDIKDRSSQIKKLEREKSSSPINAEASEQQDHLLAQETEEDRAWNDRLQYLDDQYKAAWADMDTARRLCQDAYGQCQVMRQRTLELAHMAATHAPQHGNQSLSRTGSLQQRRTPSNQASSSMNMPNFSATSGPSFGNGMPMLSEGFPSTISPFFNINNGMTLERPDDGPAMSSADVDKLTGGAMMSPAVGTALLPAGLLSLADEDLPVNRGIASDAGYGDRSEVGSTERNNSGGQVIPGLGVFSGISLLPGLGAPQAPVYPDPGPASPASVNSRSPSVFASPGASASNLAFQSPDGPIDSDGRSIRSIRSNRAVSSGAAQTGSRFSQILGLDKLNRQRGKTLSDDGPALGSLPKIQSHSMPKDSQGEELGLGKRRNSSHSGNFFGSVLSRSSAATKTAGTEELQKNTAVRRRPFQVFGGKDGWPSMRSSDNRPASPRPGSTHSTELPRPSQDSTNWGYWPSAESFGQRSSPLSADWGSAPGPPPGGLLSSRGWGSRHPSRRPSVQYAGSGGVSYDIKEDETDDSDDGSEQAYVQAPIGTRPTNTIERPPTPKLNPAAQDFKSLFSFGDKKERSEKPSKNRPKDISSDVAQTPSLTSAATSPGLHGDDDGSPAQSRKSRDTHSVATADSSTLEFSTRNSLDKTPSHSISDTMYASLNGSAGKESFMQKLSRKSSSGKFGLPVFTRDKRARGIDKVKETAGEDTEVDEDGSLSRSVDSMSRPEKPERTPSRTWSSVFASATKKGNKGKEKEKTPSISEASLTSEATGEEVDDR